MPGRSREANADGLNLQRLGGILNGLEGSPHGKSRIKVMRQMKKSKSDHTLAVAKAGLSAIPVVGGSIASLVGDYIPTATQKSIDRALELLRNRLEEFGDRIDVEAINKDDFAELFKSCYLSIVRSHRDNKLKAVPSIYSIVPPNDGSALRHGHHFEPVDFVIDHGRGHHDAYSAGSCQRTYARACGCRQRPRCHREELIESERGWSSRKAFVTMMQTADLGQGNNRSGPGRLNGSSIRCVLAERQVGP